MLVGNSSAIAAAPKDGVPHLIVYASEPDLAGREAEVISALTDAVVGVYGEWAREIAVVQLVGLGPDRWGIGGRPATAPAPRVTFGIKDAASLVAVFGERVRSGTTVELVGTPAGRSGIGGEVVLT
jgi:phenylpyruvate tautomerase PptA (4-oxalocrotonate tautomerase family)